jgi:hypothetical protein
MRDYFQISPNEPEILEKLKGKTIANVYRGDDGCSDHTLFVTFTDGTGVNIGHVPGGVLYYRGND